MYLNGVILVSAVLNFGTVDFAEGNDLPYAMFLPTYAATAWYHKKLPSDMQGRSVKDVVQMARDYANGEYMTMLAKGDALSSSERQTLTQKLVQFTGLTPDYIQKTYYRPVIYKYTQELLRDNGQVVGRFDSRYTGPQVEKTSEYQERDPSHHPTIAGCFATCINDYLGNELEVKTTLPYEVLTGRVHPWDYSNVQNEYLNVAPRLREAMVSNPDLKVWVANGYFDLATPVTAAEYTFSHMWLPEAMKGNVRMSYHDAGHMMYLLKSELLKMKSEAKSFYSSSIPKQEK
jgi:carboxypeptidase C (cathepsin A)